MFGGQTLIQILRNVSDHVMCVSQQDQTFLNQQSTHGPIHLDHGQEYMQISKVHVVSGKMYLVLVDAYSKFPEAANMKSTTTCATISGS